MALREACAVLCILGIVVSPVICANDTNPLCSILNANTTSNNASFQITISPETLIANTPYTVTVNGSGNATVILQAISDSSPVGTWLATNDSCNGSPLYVDPFQNSTHSIVTTWTSPNNASSVEISAHISVGAEVIKISRSLAIAATEAPSNNQTTQAQPGKTTTVVSQVTNMGSAKNSNFILMALIQIFGFTVITSRLLS